MVNDDETMGSMQGITNTQVYAAIAYLDMAASSAHDDGYTHRKIAIGLALVLLLSNCVAFLLLYLQVR